MSPPPSESEVQAAFEAVEAALEAGMTEAAEAPLAWLTERLPKDPKVALLQAELHFANDAVDLAVKTLEVAHARAPKDLAVLCALAGAWIEEDGDRPRIEAGLELAQKGLRLARKARDADLEHALLFLLGSGHNTLGESKAALIALEQALSLAPEDVEVRLERALALFELCRFDEAHTALTALVDEVPEAPWVHHTLGLIAERRGDEVAALAGFEQAHRLDPEAFPRAVELGEAAFDAAVQDAIDRLPEIARDALENTPVAVEPLPSDEDLLASDPPLSPTILGLFRGQAIPHRELMNPADHFPATVLLYQKNLERFARSEEELIEQIGITVLHEVGHLLGLDEEDLADRGLE